jgi:hypothetical protein
MSNESAVATENAILTTNEPFPRTQGVLMPEASVDSWVRGRNNIYIDHSTTLYLYFSGGPGVKVLYGEEAKRPEHPLPAGVTTFSYKPPNGFNLEYTIEPGGSSFKLVWGFMP